ncbi:hypothetical protein TWF730_001731 [Orbilia blumenaviensis]|uniref:Uncharacterized protein n=1 Tax=Orbilia blumenaviensis TaxID=1796055 RepID=A0AAV9UM73_9PEZI
MDRLLRRKPVKPAKPDQFVLRDPSYYQPSQLQVAEEYSNSSPAHPENADKSSESAVAASQTIKSLEATYNRRSLSYPPPKPQPGIKPGQTHPQQEQAHLRRRSTTRTTATANSHRRSGGGLESTAAHARTTSNGNDNHDNHDNHNNGVETASEATNLSPHQSHNDVSYPLSHGIREPETRSLRSTRYSRHSVDDKQPHAWTRLSGFNRFEEPSPISPTTSPNPSIRPPSFADDTSNAPLEEPKTAKQLFKERIQWTNDSQVFIPEALQPSPDLGTRSDIPPWERDISPTINGKDDDDLSSICSEDSFFEKERTKYYESLVTEAVNVRDWKAAKGHASKLKEILGLQKEHTTLDIQAQANYFLLCATIHYMLAELDDALFWIGKIPQKKSTDPSILMNRFNMEAAVAIRQGKLDEAFSISRKSGKYGRKFGLAKETNHAHYLSQLICLKRDDTSEAQFYGQMITEKDFKLPIFIETIDTPVEEPSAKVTPTPEQVYASEPLPKTPHLAPKDTRRFPNLGEALFAKAGLSIRPKGTSSRATPEYQGGTANWTVGIRLAVDADDDSESACYLYRTVYINEPVHPLHAAADESAPSNRHSVKITSPLEYAITKNKTYAALAIIQQKKAKLEDDSFESQPIQLATGRANLPIMVALLQAGVDPHKVGTLDDIPALEKVASASHYEGCRYLLAYGADPLKLGPTHRNALKVALQGTLTDHREKVIRSMLATLKAPPQYNTIAAYLRMFELKRNSPSPESAHPKTFLQPNPAWNAHVLRLLSEYLDTFRHLKPVSV